MEQIPPPTLESELPTGLYSEEEKGEILARIDAAAGAGRLTVDEAFAPKKSGLLFPIFVNLAAVTLIVGAWFGAEAYFQTRQEGLKLRTDKLFSAEATLLAKVIEDAKAQIAAANAEIGKIQADLARTAAEKADLQKSFDDRVLAQDRALRKEFAAELAAEKKRLQALGLAPAEVARRLAEFEKAKNLEFGARLDVYRRQAQAEIDQKSLAVTALQAKLQSTVAEQEKLRHEIERQMKEREGALQFQLSIQGSDIDALKKERDELNAFYKQSDTALAAVKTAFENRDWVKSQAAVDGFRAILDRGTVSASAIVRARAQTETALADAFDNAIQELEAAGPRETPAPKTDDQARVDAIRAQAKRDLAAAAVQLAEIQQQLAAAEAQGRQSAFDAEGLRSAVGDLTQKLDVSTAETLEARTSAQQLEAQVAELQKNVQDLTPYKERSDTLSKLFTSSYSNAEERFKTTFGSAAAAEAFPGFDEAWEAVAQQVREENNAQATRQRALDEVLSFTTYLRGLSTGPAAARDAATKLARNDAEYRKVVESIQALAAAGGAESSVSTATAQLYGTVAAVSGTKVTLEPLTKVRPQTGQIVELRRAVGKKETVLGRGPVLSASNSRVELDWSGNASLPLSGDAAYLVLN